MPEVTKNQQYPKTFKELLERSCALYPGRDAFRIRSGAGYQSITFTELREDVYNLAASLESRNLNGQFIAVMGENSYQWVVAYLATVVAAAVIVPIDKELSIQEISFILKRCDAMAVFCSDDYTELADELRQQFDIDFFTINGQNNTYTSCGQLMEEGRAIRENNPMAGQLEDDPEALSAIVFTSGTTGYGKGVMLSRRNFMSNLDSANKLIHLGERVLSVLPMHHTYEFTLDILYSIYQGLTICINNSIKYFAQNLKLFAPTDMLLVPLVAENLYSMVWQNIRKSGKGKLLRVMIQVSNVLMKLGIDLRRQFFKPVHDAFGGSLQSLFVGGAYFNPAVARGYHELGIKINIGYGITECSPLVTGNITDTLRYMGSCGVAIPDVQVRIKTPNSAGEGEIEVKGDNVTSGYFKNPIATAEAFDGEWFRTGDIGRFDRNNMLFITGRIKNLIVLKNGKNIYPEELESLVGRLPYVKEVLVSAQENRAGEEFAITAEIFPDRELAVEDKIEDVVIEIQTEIEGLNARLPYYKRIVSVRFRDKEFPKTTSKKIKRYIQ